MNKYKRYRLSEFVPLFKKILKKKPTKKPIHEVRLADFFISFNAT